MRSLTFFFLIAITLSACPNSSSVISYDLSVVAPGCRYPSACYAQNCSCARGSLSACVACDPQSQAAGTCDCSQFAGSVCTQTATLCVGKGLACVGSGAKCVAAGASCGGAGSAPEQVTTSGDGSTSSSARCKFTDDVCCPGTVVDAGATDASSVDANIVDSKSSD